MRLRSRVPNTIKFRDNQCPGFMADPSPQARAWQHGGASFFDFVELVERAHKPARPRVVRIARPFAVGGKCLISAAGAGLILPASCSLLELSIFRLVSPFAEVVESTDTPTDNTSRSFVSLNTFACSADR